MLGLRSPRLCISSCDLRSCYTLCAWRSTASLSSRPHNSDASKLLFQPPLSQKVQLSMGHQCWHGHGLKHVPRDATQNALLQVRMTVAAHHDQIETVVGRDR